MNLLDSVKIDKCKCGKIHESGVLSVISGSGAVEKLPEALLSLGAKRAYVIADQNTYAVCGERVIELLSKSGIGYTKFVFNSASLEPDEHALGSAVMNFDKSCDTVLAIGSGVIGDISKIVSTVSGTHYAIVATAPSMDGYASRGSSMIVNGLKKTVSSRCPEIVIGDTDILKTAPDKMLVSGLGDMLAKYVSICEWRIGNLITGEYYCESIAALVRKALNRVVSNAEGLMKREDSAILAVFEGLVLSGVAMDYAGISRPASGVEHYISHVWDMRSLEFGTNASTHGIQCAIGTLITVRLYEKIKEVLPNRDKAVKFSESFDLDAHKARLSEFLGNAARQMMNAEDFDLKYDVTAHKNRLEIIINNWKSIIEIINDELPSSEKIESILLKVGCPACCSEIGIDEKIIPDTFRATKDIRDKYILSRLAHDLGVTDEIL